MHVTMKLDRIKALIHGPFDQSEPIDALIHVLEAALELVQLPDNDFCWSYWDNSEQATAAITALITRVKAGNLPDPLELRTLFAATGPLQEVSLSSGWGEPFLIVADRYDQVERLLWPDNPVDQPTS